jgi:hypothetical protein
MILGSCGCWSFGIGDFHRNERKITMLLYAGLIAKYSTVGKPLKAASLQDQLEKKDENGVSLRPFSSVVQLNSDYLELIDRWNYDRGLLTLVMVFVMGLMSAICWALIYYFLPHFADAGVLFAGLEIFLFICCIILLSICVLGLSRESFTYTYYPTRFNRKLRKVYVIKPNKKLLVANWDDIVFIRQYTGQGQYDLRGHILNEQGIVTDAFCLPYVALSGYSSDMTGHWEFVRRYMESPTGVKEAYDATYKLFPISQRKETTAESIERVYVIANGYEDEKMTVGSNIWFLLWLPVNIIWIIGRRISILTSRTPHFPQWVEDECKVDANDVYNLETHPHPKSIQVSKPLAVRIAQGMLYAILIILSIYLAAGFIDMISAMKGHDTGLVRMLEFWNW